MRLLRRPRAWAAAAIASALLTGGASLSLQPADTTLPEAPEQASDEYAPNLELVVAPESPVFTEKDTEVSFTVLLRNDGDLSVPEGSVELALGEQFSGGSALPRPEELAAPDPAEAMPSDDAGAPVRTVIATAPIDAVAGGKQQRTTITVPVAQVAAFSATGHGVYPLYATYQPSDSASASSLSAFSPVIWEGPGDAEDSVDLTSIVPLTLPAVVHSMPTRSQLNAAVPRFEALVDYAARSHSILAIDPRIITAIRAYGTEAPQASRELLERLESGQIASFLLQYGDADPAAQADLGLTELLQPDGFEFITRFGTWEPQPSSTEDRSAPTGSPDEGVPDDADSAAAAQTGESPETEAAEPQPEADETALPPADDALALWPNGLAAAWPAEGQVGASTMALLRGAGLDLAVLRSDNVTLTGGPRAKLGESGALVTDAELDAGVRLALTGDTETERALGKAQASARLALAASSGVKGLMLGVDRGASAEVERPEELLSELTTQRWVRSVAHSAQAEGAAQLTAVRPEEERTELLRTALANEPVVLEARAALVNPEYLDSYQRMRVLSLFATKHAAPDANFAATARQFGERDNELHEGVRIVGTKRAQLVGGSTRIPIQLRNSLPFDAVVNLEVSPTSAALSLPERTFHDIQLPEDSTDRVLVPAKSRVSSGDSALLLSVTSVDGEYTASTGRLEITISSAVETVAVALLAASAALLFGFGIWRSVRRRRSPSPRE